VNLTKSSHFQSINSSCIILSILLCPHCENCSVNAQPTPIHDTSHFPLEQGMGTMLHDSHTPPHMVWSFGSENDSFEMG
jgi:hypothetical protein